MSNYKPCSTCKGTGYRKGYDHVQHGKCFSCDGFGSLEKLKEYNEKVAEKAHIKNIADSKEIIIHSYIRVKKWEAKGKGDDFLPIKNARKFAKIEMDKLKSWGIAFSLEEIEEMVPLIKEKMEAEDKKRNGFQSLF